MIYFLIYKLFIDVAYVVYMPQYILCSTVYK